MLSLEPEIVFNSLFIPQIRQDCAPTAAGSSQSDHRPHSLKELGKIETEMEIKPGSSAKFD